MVLRDGIAEEQVKPVGVPVFSLSQIGVAGFGGVCKTECAGCLVVAVEQMIHLAIHTTVRGAVGLGKIDDARLLHLLIHSHLLLRVHDVEVIVAWLQAHCELTSIAYLVAALVTFLGCDYNHTRHRARTINRGGRTVLQNLEALDVVGVQSCYRRGDKRGGIS